MTLLCSECLLAARCRSSVCLVKMTDMKSGLVLAVVSGTSLGISLKWPIQAVLSKVSAHGCVVKDGEGETRGTQVW